VITKLTLTPAVSVIDAVLFAVAVMLLLVGPITACIKAPLGNATFGGALLKLRVMLSLNAGDGCRWSLC
jgi:hypothetical protein